MERDFGYIVSDLLSGCTGPTPEPVEVQCPAATDPDAGAWLQPATTSAAVMHPHPDTPHWWPIIGADGRVADTITVSCEGWGRLATAKLLAPALADHLGISVPDVLNALARLHSNLSCLMDSPNGWAMLGYYVSTFYGLDYSERHFLPTVQ